MMMMMRKANSNDIFARISHIYEKLKSHKVKQASISQSRINECVYMKLRNREENYVDVE